MDIRAHLFTGLTLKAFIFLRRIFNGFRREPVSSRDFALTSSRSEPIRQIELLQIGSLPGESSGPCRAYLEEIVRESWRSTTGGLAAAACVAHGEH